MGNDEISHFLISTLNLQKVAYFNGLQLHVIASPENFEWLGSHGLLVIN
jgi:hypothetical protein